MTRTPPHERPSARELASGKAEPLTIAGKPADVCPYCGAGMFVHGTNTTDREIVRYVNCRNCRKRFLTVQQPAKILREVGEDSSSGNPALTLVRESA